MPVYSIKEFAKLTGRKPKDIHVYATRGKVVKNKNKQIDTTEAINFEFLEANKVNSDSIKEASKPKPDNKPKKNSPETDFLVSKHQLVIREKSEIELELKKKELEERNIRISKLKGELIAYEKAVDISKSFSEKMRKEIDLSIKRLIQKISVRYNIENSKTASYKNEVTDIINQATTIAVEKLKSEFADE